jgi:hypothetical protein
MKEIVPTHKIYTALRLQTRGVAEPQDMAQRVLRRREEDGPYGVNIPRVLRRD